MFFSFVSNMAVFTVGKDVERLLHFRRETDNVKGDTNGVCEEEEQTDRAPQLRPQRSGDHEVGPASLWWWSEWGDRGASQSVGQGGGAVRAQT
jgi:hypothetical protein